MFTKPQQSKQKKYSFYHISTFKHLCNFNNGSYTIRYEEKSKVMFPHSSFNPILSSDFPSKTYYERPREDKTTIHLGQRKLLMAEFQLLLPLFSKDSDNTNKETVVVYVGAGPGQHINILIKCFPTLKWKLIDPAFAIRPDKKLVEYQRQGICEILPVFFNDELAQKIKDECKDKNIVYISDIRKKDEQDDFPSNECIQEDMEDQCRWYKILKPIRSQFKFRLPWIDKINEYTKQHSSQYLKGDVNFPIWGKPSTTESRLVVEGPDQPMVSYNHLQYQEQMFYFNSEHRVSCFEHGITEKLYRELKMKKQVHYCHCHDCKTEIEILHLLITLSQTNKDVQVENVGCVYDTRYSIFHNIIQVGSYISDYLHQYP
jgi:hypothetical protein